MSAELLRLAERCEKETAGSRELDGLIFKAVCEKPGDNWTDMFEDVWHRRDPEDHCAFDPPPHYTSSLDCAMSLVPGGRAIRREYLPCGRWPHRVWIYRDSFMPLDDGSRRPALGKTEALALTAAALRALASRDDVRGE